MQIGHYIVAHGTIFTSTTTRYRVPVNILDFQRSTNVESQQTSVHTVLALPWDDKHT